jgi:hypothetical protein
VFSWIYDVPPLLAIVAFGVAFVGIFWLGALILRPLVRKWLHHEPGLNATLGDYLQYFGVIYGLLLGLLAVGAYQNHADAEKSVVTEARGSRRFTATFPVIPSRTAPISGRWCATMRARPSRTRGHSNVAAFSLSLRQEARAPSLPSTGA